MTENALPRSARAAVEDEVPLTVVVGVDSSANAECAAAWAAAEAERRGAPLTVVHAVHLPHAPIAPLEPYDHAMRRRAEGRALLDRTVGALRAAFPGLKLIAELSDLAPAHVLSAHSRSAGLVVTGTRGHGGFVGMLVGSVGRKLAAHAASPLVVVRATEPQDAIDEVVLGVGSKPSSAAVHYAFAAARRHEAGLTVVRAWWPRPAYGGPATPAAMYVGELDTSQAHALAGAEAAVAAQREEYPDVKVRVCAVEGNAVPVLVNAARGTCLLVVGAHRHRGPLAVGAGYVVDGALAHCPTPIAIVPVR